MDLLTQTQLETLDALNASTGMRWRVLPMDKDRSPKDIPKFLICNMPIFSLDMNVAAPNGKEYTEGSHVNRKSGSDDYMYAMRFDDTRPPREGPDVVRTIATMRDLMIASGVLHKGDMQALHHLNQDGVPYLNGKEMVMHGIALPSGVAEDVAFLQNVRGQARQIIEGCMPGPLAGIDTANTERAACEKLKKATGMEWTVLDVSIPHKAMKPFVMTGLLDVYADKGDVLRINPNGATGVPTSAEKRYYMLDNDATPERFDAFAATQGQMRNIIHKLGKDPLPLMFGGYDVSYSEKLDEAVREGCHTRLLLAASLVESPEFQQELNQQLRWRLFKTALNVNNEYRERN